jgi:hypothetical protein
LAIKLSQTIFGEKEKDLQRHAELIRQDPDAYLDMENKLNRNTDRPTIRFHRSFQNTGAENVCGI